MGLRLLPRLIGGRLLHLECDRGELVGALHHLGLCGEGLDSDPQAIAMARAQWPCARFHRCRPEEFRPETPYDVIYLSTAGRHWPADLGAVVELVDRSLDPRGSVISDTQHLEEEAVLAIGTGLATAGFGPQAGFPRSSDDPWWVYRRSTPVVHH
jgi:trans-aconitate methyltransferase